VLVAIAAAIAAPTWLRAADEPPAAAKGAPAVAAPAPPGEARVGKFLRLSSPITDKTNDRVRRVVEAFVAGSKQKGEWPVVVLEIPAGRTQFGAALDLAKYLTGPSLNGATTVAYIPQTLTGHGVLVALACNEIVMHRDGLDEKTELGDAGEHESAIDATLAAGYRQIAESRRTVPVPIALKMLDRNLELLEVETENSREFVLAADLPALRKKKAVNEPKTMLAAGRAGRFTSAQAKELGFATLLVADRKDLMHSLGLPRAALDEDPSLDGEWRPMRVDVAGPITADLVDRTIATLDRQIKEADVNFICVWLDTPGGSPTDSIRLANYLTGLAPAKRRTVAYVASKARGDAAAIALACDQIVMHRGAVLGGSGEATIDEKTVGAVEQTFRDVAKRKQRSPALAAAMINPEVVVYRYTRKDNGLTEFFTEREAADLPDADQWKQGDAIEDGADTLLLNAERAEQLGVTHHVVQDFAEFRQLYGLENDPQLIEPGWAQFLIDALNSPGMSLLLLLVGGAALYAELHAPGTGVGAFIGAICFVLYFWSAYLGGTAGWLEVLLFVFGTVCVLMEIFVFPGIGIFGLGGGLLVITSLVLASQTYVIPRNEYQMHHLRTSLLTIVGALGGTVVAAAVMRRFLPHAPMFNRVLLAPPMGEELTELSRRESLGQFEHLLHHRGTAYTPLVPGGKAMIGEQLVDVVADGEFIDRGLLVEVVEVHGTRVVVRAVGGAV
jgi:membrane-bound serine protease (ClpP class)